MEFNDLRFLFKIQRSIRNLDFVVTVSDIQTYLYCRVRTRGDIQRRENKRNRCNDRLTYHHELSTNRCSREICRTT